MEKKKQEPESKSDLQIRRVVKVEDGGDTSTDTEAGETVAAFLDFIDTIVASPENVRDRGGADGDTGPTAETATSTPEVTVVKQEQQKTEDNSSSSTSSSSKKKQPVAAAAAKGSSSSSTQKQKQKNWARQHQSAQSYTGYTPPVHVPLNQHEELQFGSLPRPYAPRMQQQQQMDWDTTQAYSVARNIYMQERYDRARDFSVPPRSQGEVGGAAGGSRALESDDPYNLFSPSNYPQNPYDCIDMGPVYTTPVTTTATFYAGSEPSSLSSSSAFYSCKPSKSKDPFQFREHSEHLKKCSSCTTARVDASVSTEPMHSFEKMINWEGTMPYDPLPSAPPYTPPVASFSPVSCPPIPYSPTHSPPPPLPTRPIPLYRAQQQAHYYPHPRASIQPQYKLSMAGRTTRVQPPVRPTVPAIVIIPPPTESKESQAETTTIASTVVSSSEPKQSWAKGGGGGQGQQHKQPSDTISRPPRQPPRNPRASSSSLFYETFGRTQREDSYVPLLSMMSKSVATTTTSVSPSTTAAVSSRGRGKTRGGKTGRKSGKHSLDYWPEYCGYGTPPPQSLPRSLLPSSSSSSVASSAAGHHDIAEETEQEEDAKVEVAASPKKHQEKRQWRKK